MKENIMKKIAILLLISSSFLIQNSFSAPGINGRYPNGLPPVHSSEENMLAMSGRTNASPNEQRNCIDKKRKTIPCKTCQYSLDFVETLLNGDRTDGCNTWTYQPPVQQPQTESSCLWNCVKKSRDSSWKKSPKESNDAYFQRMRDSSWKKSPNESNNAYFQRMIKLQASMTNECRKQLKKYLAVKKTPKNTLESWCNLQK